MAYEIRAFQCLIPAGTALATPINIPMLFPPRVVKQIEIVVPRGPSGLVGFAVAVGSQSMIPFAPGQWIVTDDEKINWDMDDQIDTGAWALNGYNLGQYDHTIYVRFLLDLVSKGDTTATTITQIPAVIAAGDLSGVDVDTTDFTA